ncbi:MAG TPA: cysteate synthase [Spirochaetia bacterium]|nr:cysteate synthase [Spirochaetia bacterium]
MIMKARQREHAKGEFANLPGSHYRLACPVCGKHFEDSPSEFLLSCPEPHSPALLKAVYRQKRLVVHSEHSGVFRFSDWLPIRRKLFGAPGPVVYRSQGLGPYLGLENLFVIFNGFWPEKGALMETCTFKELEAQAVCGRVVEDWDSCLVVSSAGNTARAFLQACSRYDVPAFVVVPGNSLPLLWSTGRPKSSVRLAVLEGEADYTDAIALGNGIANMEGYYSEGGARNVARRDGMGTAVLRAVEEAGEIPQHYFQAVGSGTGAIAAWEMNERLVGDGRFGARKMKLHLAQNAPFTPMVDAWEAGSRIIAGSDEAAARKRVHSIRAQVLANRNPPYSLAGGLYDALRESGGFMYRVSNEDSERAGRLFAERELIDIDPAAEVAVASLIQARSAGRVRSGDLVALNITGGGRSKLQAHREVEQLTPDVRFTLADLGHKEPGSRIRELVEAAG